MLEINYELQDIVLMAFRYALGRRTYVTLQVCDYIKNNPQLINERVKSVILRDLEGLNEFYDTKDIDYEVFVDFKNWLESYEVNEK